MAGLNEESPPFSSPPPAADKEWQAVRQALAREEWDFRTADGLARETGISAERIRKVLEAHGDEVRVSMVPDKQGRILYTLRSRPKGFREILATARAFVTKST